MRRRRAERARHGDPWRARQGRRPAYLRTRRSARVPRARAEGGRAHHRLRRAAHPRLSRSRARRRASGRHPAFAGLDHPAPPAVSGCDVRSERLQPPSRSHRHQPLHHRRDRRSRRSPLASRRRRRTSFPRVVWTPPIAAWEAATVDRSRRPAGRRLRARRVVVAGSPGRRTARAPQPAPLDRSAVLQPARSDRVLGVEVWRQAWGPPLARRPSTDLFEGIDR